jgi:hypothetical protein
MAESKPLPPEIVAAAKAFTELCLNHKINAVVMASRCRDGYEDLLATSGSFRLCQGLCMGSVVRLEEQINDKEEFLKNIM